MLGLGDLAGFGIMYCGIRVLSIHAMVAFLLFCLGLQWLVLPVAHEQ
jgi:hypothetical protein